tara:strand:+ start:152 stop:919 length:768 start_codon:yes stop_codon:yes gene_type:complete
MKDKDIIFSAPIPFNSMEECQPIKASDFYPSWYKKLKHSIHNKTIKGCVPVQDAITAGYLLKLTQDFEIRFGQEGKEKNEQMTEYTYAFKTHGGLPANPYNLGNLIQDGPVSHPSNQVGGDDSFMVKQQKMPFFKKIINPWHIKTPPGYSCMFVSPMHREEDHFHILPGIVDTDVFPMNVHFPITINSAKYPKFEKLFKKGTPYVQVIPFKRDSWKMKIEENNFASLENRKNSLDFATTILNWYRTKFWNKKVFK